MAQIIIDLSVQHQCRKKITEQLLWKLIKRELKE